MARKNINLALDEELVDWVAFASSFYGGSATKYINDAIRRDFEEQGGLISRSGVAEAWDSWYKVRHGQNEQSSTLEKAFGVGAPGTSPDEQTPLP